MEASYNGVHNYLCGLENDPGGKQLQARFGNDTFEADISSVSSFKSRGVCPNWVKTGECNSKSKCPYTRPKLERSLMLKLYLTAKNGKFGSKRGGGRGKGRRGRGGRGHGKGRGGKKSKKQVANIRKKIPCHFFAKGNCNFGDDYRYSLDGHEAGTADADDDVDLPNFDAYDDAELSMFDKVADLSMCEEITNVTKQCR